MTPILNVFIEIVVQDDHFYKVECPLTIKYVGKHQLKHHHRKTINYIDFNITVQNTVRGSFKGVQAGFAG